jgi:hypothetical protein
MTTADKILAFYKQLKIKGSLPRGIDTMNPYEDDYTFRLCEQFYRKYYNDDGPRRLMLGINPGRFGSGTTGISFTDPVRLEKVCHIDNTLNKKPELSADFIYRMIEAFGGPQWFYQTYFISAVSPLGFTKNGININYYDDNKLMKAVLPFIIDSISQLAAMGFLRDTCFCIGEGKNFDFLGKLNDQHHWFDKIVPLAHPRFIMQYKRKQLDRYIAFYLENLIPGPSPKRRREE